MNKINIKMENGIKVINGRTLDEILKNYKNNENEYIIVRELFNNITCEEDFISQLRSKKSNFSKTEMLIYIKMLGNFNLIDAYPIFDKIYEN